jgi:hypothetical protein
MVNSLCLSVNLLISMAFYVGGLYYELADAPNSRLKMSKSDIQHSGIEILLQIPLFISSKGFRILYEKKKKLRSFNPQVNYIGCRVVSATYSHGR